MGEGLDWNPNWLVYIVSTVYFELVCNNYNNLKYITKLKIITMYNTICIYLNTKGMYN